jgi:acyl-CoA reductase-like NAD-dependent aldehyde dehydrogenase
MLKNYKDFLNEDGLDLSLDDLGGDKKKEEAPDPAKEIAKAKEKKLKKAEKARAEELDAAEEKLKDAFKKTSSDFRTDFEKRIMDALDDDDRVSYHVIITDIQASQVQNVKDGMEKEVEATAPVIKVLQSLNKNEYRG